MPLFMLKKSPRSFKRLSIMQHAHNPKYESIPDTLQVQDGSPPLASSWDFLRDFTRKEFRGLATQFLSSKEQRDRLREAIQIIYSKPNLEVGWNPEAFEPEVLLGVLASDVRLAVRGLRDWCEALGLEYIPPEVKVMGATSLAEVRGNVYIKYNSKSRGCSISMYQGKDRGVLLQLGQQQLGHFPIGMWDEDQIKQPPLL